MGINDFQEVGIKIRNTTTFQKNVFFYEIAKSIKSMI